MLALGCLMVVCGVFALLWADGAFSGLRTRDDVRVDALTLGATPVLRPRAMPFALNRTLDSRTASASGRTSRLEP
jgi:hypothetical protein